MSSVTIRSAQLGDSESLGRLFDQLGYPQTRDDLGSRLRTLHADPRADLLVAAEGDVLLGLVAIFFVPVAHEIASWCRITALVVDAGHRRRGVGQALATAAEEAARQAGCVRIEATSARHRIDAHHFDAHHFYERLDFLKRPPAGRSL
jgi:GNAT superfamily N-acetyltransferase